MQLPKLGFLIYLQKFYDGIAMETLIPFWIKISFTLMVAVIVPVYWKYWGPKNFLWFSDIALFGLTIALWLENSMLASMMAVMALIAEVAWNLDLIARLVFNIRLFGLTSYLFDDDQPLFVRLLTLFHIPLLVVMVFLVSVLGYESDAFIYQLPLTWGILITTYLSKPEENINWVFGWGDQAQKTMQPLIYFLLLMIAYPVLVMLPAHYLLKILFG